MTPSPRIDSEAERIFDQLKRKDIVIDAPRILQWFSEMAIYARGLETEIAKLKKSNKSWAIDSSDDLEHAKEVAKRFFPAEKVDGDSFGVPGVSDLIDMLAEEIAEAKKPCEWVPNIIPGNINSGRLSGCNKKAVHFGNDPKFCPYCGHPTRAQPPEAKP